MKKGIKEPKLNKRQVKISTCKNKNTSSRYLEESEILQPELNSNKKFQKSSHGYIIII